MSTFGHALFDTAIGRCGIAWGPAGITGVRLPDRSDAATLAGVARHRSGSVETPPPDSVARVIADLVALTAGRPVMFEAGALDWEGIGTFEGRVYHLTQAIPPGRTRTYGELAAALGEPGAARAVGQALGRNPFPLIVPCHRVLAAGRATGGFSAPGGAATKMRLLEIEGAGIPWQPSLPF